MVRQNWSLNSPRLNTLNSLNVNSVWHCLTQSDGVQQRNLRRLDSLATNQTGKLNPINEARDVVDKIVSDCKVLFLQCLGRDDLVYLISEQLSLFCRSPLLLFSFCVVFKRFSCQVNTFLDTPRLVLFSFLLALIDNILMSDCSTGPGLIVLDGYHNFLTWQFTQGSPFFIDQFSFRSQVMTISKF